MNSTIYKLHLKILKHESLTVTILILSIVLVDCRDSMAIENKLGGIIFWQLSNDSFSNGKKIDVLEEPGTLHFVYAYMKTLRTWSNASPRRDINVL